MITKKVVYHTADEAGANISKILADEYGIDCIGLEARILDLETVPDPLEGTGLCIVASCHRSESGKPTLTVHSPGNYGVAEAGGSDRKLAVAPALYLKAGLSALKARAVPGYECSFEATHHGPTCLPFPVMFAEVGSTVKEWGDEDACRAVAGSIALVVGEGPDEVPAALGIGGGHYCRKFSKVADYALGHICPRYNLHNLDDVMLSMMTEKTVPEPEAVLVEKKGLGTEKKRVCRLLEGSGLETVWI